MNELTLAELLDRLRALAPRIADSRAAFDRDRQLPDEIFAALADAGLFRLWLPRALGGADLTPMEFREVVEAAAALDGSVAWLVGNGGGMARAGGYLPRAVGEEIFAAPRAFIASSTASIGTLTEAPGGWRLTGRWPFGSGSPHATHFVCLAAPGGEPGPDRPIRCCYLPREAVIRHDNWHVSGLRGTGSSDFEIRDVFVPADWTHPLVDPVPTAPGVVFRLPSIAAFGWTVSCVPLGLAKGALAAFVAAAASKARQGATSVMRDREVIQAMVGRSDADVRAARLLMRDAMDEACTAVEVGGDRLVGAMTGMRQAAAHGAETALEVIGRIEAETGASALREGNPIERAGRDLRAAAKHISVTPTFFGAAGRMILGLEPGLVRS
jgi:alkylation response protein AidB-like acyl-CoA dehydrogenase